MDDELTELDMMMEQAHRNASDNSLLREEVRHLKNLLFRCVIEHDFDSIKTATSMFEFTPIQLDDKVPF